MLSPASRPQRPPKTPIEIAKIGGIGVDGNFQGHHLVEREASFLHLSRPKMIPRTDQADMLAAPPVISLAIFRPGVALRLVWLPPATCLQLPRPSCRTLPASCS